jgi:hypothetical protein
MSVDAPLLRREQQLPALDRRSRGAQAAGEEGEAARLVALAGEGAGAADATRAHLGAECHLKFRVWHILTKHINGFGQTLKLVWL